MNQDPNQKLKWLVLCAGFYINTFALANCFAIGSLLDEMLVKYKESLSKTATVQAILMGVAFISGGFSGILISRFGMVKVTLTGAVLCPLGFILSSFASSILHLYVYIGIVSGFGISILYVGSATAIGGAFTGSQRLLALVVQAAGLSIGVIVIPYIADFLVDRYGLNGTFLVLGGIYTNSLPAALILCIADRKQHKTTTENNTKQQNKVNETSSHKVNVYVLVRNFRLFKEEIRNLKKNIGSILNAPYVLSVLGIGVIVGSLNGCCSLLVDILLSKAFTKTQALYAFPITYGMGLIACLLPGIVKQFKGVNSFVLPAIFGICGFAGQLIICNSRDIGSVLVGCGLSGIPVAGVASGAYIMVVQLVEKQHFSTAFGFVFCTSGIVSAISGPTYGAIVDSTQSYTIVLYTTAVCQGIGTLLFICTIVIRKRRHPDSLTGHDTITLSFCCRKEYVDHVI